MQVSPEQIREVARAITVDFLGKGASAELLFACVCEHLERAFPTPAPDPNAVVVRIAVARHPSHEGGEEKFTVSCCAIDDIDDEESAGGGVFCGDDTHRAWITAPIPPVTAIPTVQASSVEAV